MELIISVLKNNKSIQILVIFIVLDVIFGFLRSIKERRTNSTIGIDGIIRKTGMLITICVSLLIDNIVNIDLLFFIPEELKTILSIEKCGIVVLFNSLYVIFESLSILKNMRKCGIPFPTRLNNFLEKILMEFTAEVNDESEKINSGEKSLS